MITNHLYIPSDDSLIHVYSGESIRSVKNNGRERQNYKGKKHRKDEKEKEKDTGTESESKIDIRC